MIISRTPFRLSFFGGGTDYPVWFREHGGAVLSTTIDKYAYITCRHFPPFFKYKYRLSYSRIEEVDRIEEIHHPSARACLRYMDVQRPLSMSYDGDLPARTGLGSSSTFTVGLLKALYALRGELTDNNRLAREAIHVEQELIGESVGCQDQLAAAIGGFNLMRFGPGDKIDVQPFRFDKNRRSALHDHLILVFTGFSRFGQKITRKVMKNTSKKEKEFLIIRQIVDEAVRILQSTGPVDRQMTEFGRLLHEAWRIKRTLTAEISNPTIDSLYATARRAGAIGGKLLGAGGGGFFLLFAPPERHSRIKKALHNYLPIPFEFEDSGSRIIFSKPEEYDVS
ncbi:MAG TPA: kinase [Elusimicrobiota bacterium]|nr:kinase [Elusimicrobiota bacterium]